jgi:hypothetical protein
VSAITLTADMPIQVSARLALELRRGKRIVVVRRLPRELFVDAHERQCEANHGQTLERIRERSGFDALEAIAVLSCLPFEAVASITEETAHRILYGWHSSFNRGKRVAEALAKTAA